MLELLRVPLPIVVGEAIGIPLLRSVSFSFAVKLEVSTSGLRMGAVIVGRLDAALVLPPINLDLD